MFTWSLAHSEETPVAYRSCCHLIPSAAETFGLEAGLFYSFGRSWLVGGQAYALLRAPRTPNLPPKRLTQ